MAASGQEVLANHPAKDSLRWSSSWGHAIRSVAGIPVVFFRTHNVPAPTSDPRFTFRSRLATIPTLRQSVETGQLMRIADGG